MSSFEVHASDYMVSPVHTVRDDDRLAIAEDRMRSLDVSALPVVNGHGVPVGLISRNDLLQAGRLRLMESPRRVVLSLPDARVAQYRSPDVAVVTPETPMHEVARQMLSRRVHRIFVVDDCRLAGVLTTREVVRLVADVRSPIPLARLMTTSIVSIRTDEPLSLAVDRIAAAHVSGLVVVDEGWPVGIFSEREALAARFAAPDRSVEEWMSPAILCLPEQIPAHRAAAQVFATGARRILAVDGQEVLGVVSGTDFARLVSRRGEP